MTKTRVKATKRRSSPGRAQPRPGATGAAVAGADTPDESAFPIVGVGSSAGGLEALKKLLAGLRADCGIAVVLVPHLDPSHESLMAPLLGRASALPVIEASHGMRVERNHVYVIPPNADMTVREGVLHIVPPAHSHPYSAIDGFLQSLATDRQDTAVGIILSGTGTHGTLGLRAIKAAGGTVLVQTPESAEHDQMPRAAIASGLADEVLPPEGMADALMRHAVPTQPPVTPGELGEVLTVLRVQVKRDFRGYRKNMLVRRTRRRMAMRGLATVTAYVDYLRTHPEEVAALGRDLSIGVTAFFREPEAFHVLEQVAIPELVSRSRRTGDGERPVRVWVPGCSTGEEAYSVAMLFLEQFAAARQPVHLQVFATDVDDTALAFAREGRYADALVADLAPERLRRFFVRADDHHYQVSQALREVVTFAPQNLVSDAPFSRLDLITCRNVLIYLEPEYQTKVIALFHFALNDDGYLMLGPAESVASAADRFEPVSKKWRLYRRVGTGRRALVDIPILPASGPAADRPRRDDRPRPIAFGEVLHRALLNDYAPAATLVNRRLDVLSVQGPLVDYLEFPPGEWTRDLLSMARPGLRSAIRSVCKQALDERRAVVEAHARVKRNGAYVACTVAARPVSLPADADGLMIVTFQDSATPHTHVAAPPPTPRRDRRAESAVVQQLEDELRSTRDELQGTIDELQAANEELKGSHEELLSVNEELQSANEELETSKEELQSLNEELSTVNSQLQEKVRELDGANNDMVNLLASTDIAGVFLDLDLRIKRFTPPTLKLLNLLPADAGRPFADIRLRVTDPALLADCQRVIDQLTPAEAIVPATAGQVLLRRVLPYRTADNRIDGVVIIWVDIGPRLAAEADARRLQAVLDDSNDAVALLEPDGTIASWNGGAKRLYGYTEAEARALRLQDLAPDSHREAMLLLLRRVAAGETKSESASTARVTKDGRTRDVWVTITAIGNDGGHPVALLATEQDVTVITEARVAKAAVRFYERMLDEFPLAAVLCEDGRLTVNRTAEALTGHARTELTTERAWCAALHGDGAAAALAHYRTVTNGVPHHLQLTRHGGDARQVLLTVSRIDDTHVLWTLLDITEATQAEQALRTSEDYLRSIINTVDDAIVAIDEHGAIDVFNPAAERLFGYTAAEAAGMNVRALMAPPHRDAHDSYIQRYLDTGERHVIGLGIEVWAQRKDGTIVPARLGVGEIAHPRHFVGVLHDLRSRRALEWRLADSQVEERRHLAREMHDEIGGHMTGIGLLAQTLQAQLAALDSPLAARAQVIVEAISTAHHRLRAVIRGVMPVDAVPEGLEHALTDLAARCASVSGISCRLQCDAPAPVDDPGTALHLYRIAQEAVNNAVRHAKPQEVVLTLARANDRVEISVADDGLGMTPPAEAGGIGLKSMQQRARLLGGDCVFEARAGGGTVVKCWVPASARPDGLGKPRPAME